MIVVEAGLAPCAQIRLCQHLPKFSGDGIDWHLFQSIVLMDACRSETLVLEGCGGKCITIPIADWKAWREHFFGAEPVDESQIDFTVNDALLLSMTGDGDVAGAKMQSLKQEGKPVPLVVFAVRMSEAGNSTERRILLEAILKLIPAGKKVLVPPLLLSGRSSLIICAPLNNRTGNSQSPV